MVKRLVVSYNSEASSGPFERMWPYRNGRQRVRVGQFYTTLQTSAWTEQCGPDPETYCIQRAAVDSSVLKQKPCLQG